MLPSHNRDENIILITFREYDMTKECYGYTDQLHSWNLFDISDEI